VCKKDLRQCISRERDENDSYYTDVLIGIHTGILFGNEAPHTLCIPTKPLWNIKTSSEINGHVRWVPCHHGMSCPQTADGGDGLQIWRVAENILNKQL
jgi:hypothetical protein